MSGLLDAALDAAVRGYEVFELKPAVPGDTRSGKNPRFRGWQASATTDPAEIKRRWTERPRSNVGIALTAQQYVLDADSPASIAAVAAMDLQPTLTVRSGRTEGGRHYYFVVRGGVRLRNLARVCEVEGLEGKTAGKLVVWAGSLHHSGARYAIEEDRPAAVMPSWLVERIGERQEYLAADELTADELAAIAELASRRSPEAAAAMRAEAVERFAEVKATLDANLPTIAVGWGDEFFRQSVKVGRAVGIGVLSWADAVEALDYVARCHGVTDDDGQHVFRSIRRGVAAGARAVWS